MINDPLLKPSEHPVDAILHDTDVAPWHSSLGPLLIACKLKRNYTWPRLLRIICEISPGFDTHPLERARIGPKQKVAKA
jgi:hypothetical protein